MTQELVLYTTSEVARQLGVDDSTVRRWVSSGKVIPAVTTPGGHKRFTEDQVDQLRGGAIANA